MVSMAMNMLNNRLNELRQTANPPFTSAGAEYGEYFLAKTKEAFSISASSKIDGIDLATKTILEEAERARRFGFTPTEYDRARANYLQAVESAYNEREKPKVVLMSTNTLTTSLIKNRFRESKLNIRF